MRSARRTSAFHAFDVVCCFFRALVGFAGKMGSNGTVSHMQCSTGISKAWPPFPLSPPELRDTPVAGADGERVLPPGRPPPLQVLPCPPAKRVVLLKPHGSTSIFQHRTPKRGCTHRDAPRSRSQVPAAPSNNCRTGVFVTEMYSDPHPAGLARRSADVVSWHGSALIMNIKRPGRAAVAEELRFHSLISFFKFLFRGRFGFLGRFFFLLELPWGFT